MKGFWYELFHGSQSEGVIPVQGENSVAEDAPAQVNEEQAPKKVRLSKSSMYFWIFVIVVAFIIYILANNPFKMLSSDAAKENRTMCNTFKEWNMKEQPGVKLSKVRYVGKRDIPGFGAIYSPDYYTLASRRAKLSEALEVIQGDERFLQFVAEENAKEYKANYLDKEVLTPSDSTKMLIDAEYITLLADALMPKQKEAVISTISSVLSGVEVLMGRYENINGVEYHFTAVEAENGSKCKYEYVFASPADTLNFILDRKEEIKK